MWRAARPFVLVLLVLLAVGSPLCSQDKPAPPTTTAPAASPIAGVRKTILDNGLVVLTKEVHTAPIVSAMMWYRVGSRNEELSQTGKSHFLEHMLFKGTDRYKKGEIDLITLKNGGSNNAFTSEDFTAYYFNFASDRWDVALQIESNRMTHNSFAPEEYAPEKQVVIEELQINLDSPWGALTQEVQATAYKVHPYHSPVVGWIQDLERASAQDMERYYRRFYHPNNAILVLVGDFDTEKALQRVRELFGPIPRGSDAPPVSLVEPAQQGEKRVVVRKATNLERLAMVFHAPEIAHPDSYPLQVAATLLATGKTSRLYQRLVERDQSVTHVNASYNEAKDPTLFWITAEVKPSKALAEVERAVQDEMEKLKQAPVSSDELQKAKNLIEAQFILDNETTLSQAILLGGSEVLLSYEYLGTYLDNIRKVSAEDVVRVAHQYLSEDNRTVGWLVPKPGEKGGEQAEQAGVRDEQASDPVAAWLANAARHRFGRLHAEPRAEKEKTAKKEKSVVPVTSFEIRRGLPGERRVLPNGLTLLVAENHNIPAVAVRAVVHAGRRYETDDKAGLTTLLGRVLSEGTKTRSANQIAGAIESVGGSLATSSDYEDINVSSSVLKKDFDLSLELVRDILLNATFPQERVALQRDRLAAEIEAAKDNPRTVASWQFNEVVFAGHPEHLPSLGYEPTVRKLTRDDLVVWQAKYFAPDNTVIAVVGDINLPETMAKLEKAFGEWTWKPLPEPKLPKLARQTDTRTKYVYMDKEQVNIYIGHLGIARSNPDYYALEVMDTILGGGPGFTSRIPGHLRDEQGLAYSTFSNITGSAGVDPGRFIAYIGASPKNMEKAIQGILHEIATIVKEPVQQSELDDAKAYLTGSFVFRFETDAEIAGFLLEAETYNLGFDYVQRYPALIRTVTVDDIRRVTKQYLDPGRYTLVVVGPVNEKGEVIARH